MVYSSELFLNSSTFFGATASNVDRLSSCECIYVYICNCCREKRGEKENYDSMIVLVC